MTNPETDTLHAELAAHLAAQGEGDVRAGGPVHVGEAVHAGGDVRSGGGVRVGGGAPAGGPERADGPVPATGPARPDAYRVERVLKESPSEVTQLVWFRGAGGGDLGPFVRKFLTGVPSAGSAYRELAQAQRAGRRFRHLPRIIDCHDEDGRLVVVMEYIAGPTLREVIAAARPEQRPLLAARLMPALCEAASELHEAFAEPVIHRDLTPGNIICPEGDPLAPVLIDLGIARVWREGAAVDTTHFGTRAYAPPEQFGFGQTDVRSDVYALGLLAFFCLTGRDPQPSDRAAGFVAPGVSEPWRGVIARAAAFDPGERYASARELREACVAAGASAEAGTARPAVTAGDVCAAVVAAPAAGANPGGPVLGASGSGMPAADVSVSGGMPASGAPAFGMPAPAAPSLTPGAPAARGLRVSALAFFSRIPDGVGIAWNTILIFGYVVLVAACIGNIVSPRGNDRSTPIGLLVFEYAVFMPLFLAPYTYALLDRRRLRRRFPVLARHSIVWEWGVCLVVMLASSLVFGIVVSLTSSL